MLPFAKHAAEDLRPREREPVWDGMAVPGAAKCLKFVEIGLCNQGQADSVQVGTRFLIFYCISAVAIRWQSDH